MTEILAPAGSIESFFAAINGGADGVYLGLDLFSARKNAPNFTRENLPFYLDYAHILGVKVYVALNTLVSDKELSDFLEYVGFCNDAGVDGVILQDMLLGKYIHECFPDLPLHLSTQAGVNNVMGARLAKRMGFCRVVLARETPFEDITEISKIIETEVFVQGALCTAFSGQCYLSSFAGNQSGNRGLCKQPCRKMYTLSSGEYKKTGYQISLSDLSVREKISDLSAAGVTSFKIEGRMRKDSYVYQATKYYKELISGKSPSISPLSRTFNRGGYTYGLGFGQDKTLISDKVQSHVGEVIGKVAAVKNQSLKISTSHKFSPGDAGKILSDGIEKGNYVCQKDGTIRYQGQVKVGDTATITTDTLLENSTNVKPRLLPVEVNARFLTDSYPEITVSCGNVSATVVGDEVLSAAKNSPLSPDEIVKSLSKVADLPLLPSVKVDTDGVFMAKSALNGLRRLSYENFARKLVPNQKRNRRTVPLPTISNRITKSETIVISNDFSDICDLDFDIAVFAPDDYSDKEAFIRFFDCTRGKYKTYLYLFGKLSAADNRLIAPLIEKFDGIYTDGYYGIELSEDLSKPLILGSGTNVYNVPALWVALSFTDKVALSKELSHRQAQDLKLGFYYAGGAVKVMDLCYCPFKMDCKSCPYEKGATLFDGTRKFKLRRVKLNGCRFEVYNCTPLVTDFNGNKIYNFIDVDGRTYLNSDDLNALKAAVGDYTTGHHNKPLE